MGRGPMPEGAPRIMFLANDIESGFDWENYVNYPDEHIPSQPADALKGSQESFLSQVARLFRIGRQSIKQSVDIRRSFGHQTFEGCRLSASQSFKELIFDSGANLGRSCRGILFQIRLPSEGDLLSVAH